MTGIECHDEIKTCIRIAVQRTPPTDSALPVRSHRRKGAPLDVIDRGVVNGDHAGAGTGFDRHVADRHAAFHRQRADRAAGKLDRITIAAGRADLADHRQHDIFCRHAFWQRSVDLHKHSLGFFGQQGLGGQHVLHFGSANAMRQTTERAMRRRMRIAAHNRHAWQRCTLLGADHVNDTLALVAHIEIRHAVGLRIGVEGLDLQA